MMDECLRLYSDSGVLCLASTPAVKFYLVFVGPGCFLWEMKPMSHSIVREASSNRGKSVEKRGVYYSHGYKMFSYKDAAALAEKLFNQFGDRFEDRAVVRNKRFIK